MFPKKEGTPLLIRIGGENMKRILAYFFLLITILCILGSILLVIEGIMLGNALRAANASGHAYLPLVIMRGMLVALLLIGAICFLLFLICK